MTHSAHTQGWLLLRIISSALALMAVASDAGSSVVYPLKVILNGHTPAAQLYTSLFVGSVFIRKWVAPIRALIVPKGCSTVSRRSRIFSGCSSSLRCTASRMCSCSHRVIRRSLPVVQLFLMPQLWQALVQ